jgi:hypothetical protein
LKEEIIIFTGSFGSGKTEIAINQSIEALKSKERVVIVDLDIVNPYFRSRDMREKLKDIGIDIIAPPGKFAMADLPLISPEIKGVIQDSNRKLLIDVGGDEIGAKSLASFYPVLKNSDYQMNMVINPYRPFTQNSTQIHKMLQDIELSSRLKINGLISNPNLEEQTNLEVITKGHNIVKEVSKYLDLPIRYLTIEKSIYQEIGKPNFTEDTIIIRRYMNLPWDEPENENGIND